MSVKKIINVKFWSNYLFIFCAIFCFASCDIMQNSKTDPLLDDALKEQYLGRSAWQKPNLVIEKLGDLSHKTVADIGAGTGYFSFRLAFKAEKVIAIDIDPNMIKLIDLFKTNLPNDIQERIETRLALPENPKLKDDEVDVVFIMNTIAYIDNPQKYLAQLKPKMKEGGIVMIVDYKSGNLEINAPPTEERISQETVGQIMNASGLNIIDNDSETLDYQYIVIGKF
ncbi:MAG: methyltransferase domain-containing protein [Saprospiraceae bacterium]|nr:methyltransferase domain-containing protein [Saprospiraceae bacterium]